jgi:hypothetical protein
VKIMELDAEEFLRRFLLHVVPDGFFRIRHFGLLANRHRAPKLAQCRALLPQPPPTSAPPKSTQALMLRVTGLDIERCPVCQRASSVKSNGWPQPRQPGTPRDAASPPPRHRLPANLGAGDAAAV